MSAAEKLQELGMRIPDPPDPFTDDEQDALWKLYYSLPELIAVVEAAEEIDKSYVDLGAVSANLGDLLEALNTRLGEKRA